ncbi:MAG: GAF domain-containing protein, partial [Planctomycetota bacterium]
MAKKLAKEVEILADVAKAFAESLNLEATLESILHALETHVKLERGAIALLDPESETIAIKVAHGLSNASKKQVTYKVGEGITGIVVQTGKEVVVPDISKDPRFLAKTGERARAKGQKTAFVCVPIKLESKTIGAISVDRKVRPSDDFDAYVRLLEVLATMVAQAVKLNKLVESDRRELRTENERLLRELKTKFNIHNMIGTSSAMLEVYRLIEQVANSNATVLIRGESGTGKDLIAHAVHYNSLRAKKPF